MTDEGRKQHIQRALAAREEKAAGERRSHPLPWRGEELHYFPVVALPLDVPLLNADSHRIRAELEPKHYDYVRKERTSERAQSELAKLWKKAHRKFDKLKDDLAAKGQEEPGVITRDGVLVNGNTRLVALRELNDPNRQFIRLAVLDADATPFEIAQLELRLQVRDPLRDPYKLSNELLFIEELARQFHMTPEQIAGALGWSPARPVTGRKKVELHRQIYQLIREMQRRDPNLPITFFDDKLQHLKELEQKYADLIASGETGKAGLLLDTWLVVARSGFDSVHQIRAVLQREDFIPEYILPRLSEQKLIGEDAAERLVRGKRAKKIDLPGLSELDTGEADGKAAEYDLKPLLRLVESRDEKLTLPGNAAQHDGEQVKTAIRTAIDNAVKDYRAEDKADSALNAPIEALRKASAEVRNASEAYRDLRGTKEFERQARGGFDYQFKTLRKRVKALEELVAGKERAPAET
jgi:hypothetical protein